MIANISPISTNPVQTTDSSKRIRPHGPPPDPAPDASEADSNSIGAADTSADGSISKDELSAMLTKTSGGTESSDAISAKVDEIFKQIDTDGDGTASKSELTAALKTAHHHHMHAQASSDANSTDTTSPFAALISRMASPSPAAGYTSAGTVAGTTDLNTFSATA